MGPFTDIDGKVIELYPCVSLLVKFQLVNLLKIKMVLYIYVTFFLLIFVFI